MGALNIYSHTDVSISSGAVSIDYLESTSEPLSHSGYWLTWGREPSEFQGFGIRKIGECFLVFLAVKHFVKMLSVPHLENYANTIIK